MAALKARLHAAQADDADWEAYKQQQQQAHACQAVAEMQVRCHFLFFFPVLLLLPFVRLVTCMTCAVRVRGE